MGRREKIDKKTKEKVIGAVRNHINLEHSDPVNAGKIRGILKREGVIVSSEQVYAAMRQVKRKRKE